MSDSMTSPFDEFLEDLAEELQIPESRYEEADSRYKAVGEWLHRPGSVFERADPQVYIQGSFRLGTAIRPVTDTEDYDVDLVCEVAYTKDQITQERLKHLLGIEIAAYARAHGMREPEPGRRCWTLVYAKDAQFHLDALPALPDGIGRRAILESRGFINNKWTQSAIAITDTQHPEFGVRTVNWPHSNPKGYSEWFQSCMKMIFEERRRRMALLESVAKVENIPEYRVRTPLQSAVQILKRHRDMMFIDNPDDKPISIIITTLAARSYRQEASTAAALRSILAGMDEHIEDRAGVAWIPNPTDPLENFADKWVEHPERAQAFYDWLHKARADFAGAARLGDVSAISKALEPRFGRLLTEAAASRRRSASQPGGLMMRAAGAVQGAAAKLKIIFGAPHRQAPPWSMQKQNTVTIRSVTRERNGHRPEEIGSDGPPVFKHDRLTFHAQTDVPSPFRVYWQVVNTGDEAHGARGLRGGFDEGAVIERGRLTRRETALYRGVHSIECYIVKSGVCVAFSGPFLVNIA